MTRETKVGVAVAASFLSLVGVVVAARLTQKPEQSGQGAGTAIAQGPNSPDSNKKAVASTKAGAQPAGDNRAVPNPSKPPTSEQQAATATPKEGTAVLPASYDPTSGQQTGKPDAGGVSPPPALSVEAATDATTKAINESTGNASKPISNVATDVNSDLKNKANAAVAEVEKNARVNVDATGNQLKAEKLLAEINKEKKGLTGPAQEPNPVTGLNVSAQGKPVVEPPPITLPEAPAAAPPAVQNPSATVVPPAAVSNPAVKMPPVSTTVPPPALSSGPPIVPPPPNAVADAVPPPNANVAVKIPDAPAPAPAGPTIPPGPLPAKENNVSPPVVPIVALPAAPAPVTPVSGVAAVQNTGPKDAASLPSPSPTTAPNSVPAIGATTQVTSPPIPVKSQVPVTNARSYDTESYVTQPGDQSFADISRRVYNSDQYSRALVLFNRDHPFASADVKQDPPQVKPGTRVYFPPIDVLKSKYPEAFGSPVQANNSVAPVQFGKATPLTAMPGDTNVAAGPPPGTKSAFGPGPGNTYRVRDGGERLYEIAQSLLGDGSRWPQIYRLNPDVQPAYPVPAGTVLKLPTASN
jgi:hypothetical protein